MSETLPPAAAQVLRDAKRICAVAAPTFAEGRRAALVQDLFAAAGATAYIDDVGNVVAGFGGGEGPAAVLAAHLDTVFGADVTIEIRDQAGRIHAPGIGDNSLGVAALLHLARRLAARPPATRVVLAATVGEEGLGDLRGAKHLLATVPCRAFVAVEGGMLDSLETAGIGSTRYRVTYRGPGGHSWSDRGTPSAIHGLIEVAARFLATPAAHGVARNVGTVTGGTSINTIATTASLELDLRAQDARLLGEVAEAARAAFATAPAGLRAQIEIIGQRPSGALAPDHPLLAAARRARQRAGLAPAHEHASSTDANAAYGIGIPALTVGLTSAHNVHRTDEYIETAPVPRGLLVLDLLTEELAAGRDASA